MTKVRKTPFTDDVESQGKEFKDLVDEESQKLKRRRTGFDSYIDKRDESSPGFKERVTEASKEIEAERSIYNEMIEGVKAMRKHRESSPKVFRGMLTPFAETGTEGWLWAVQDNYEQEHWDYRDLQIIEDGDHLTIYDPVGRQVYCDYVNMVLSEDYPKDNIPYWPSNYDKDKWVDLFKAGLGEDYSQAYTGIIFRPAHKTIQVSVEAYDKIKDMIANPAAPTERLREAMNDAKRDLYHDVLKDVYNECSMQYEGLMDGFSVKHFAKKILDMMSRVEFDKG